MNKGDLIADLSKTLSAEFDKLGESITPQDRELGAAIIVDIAEFAVLKNTGGATGFSEMQANTAKKLMTSGAAEALNRTVNAVFGRIAKTAVKVAGTFAGAALKLEGLPTL